MKIQIAPEKLSFKQHFDARPTFEGPAPLGDMTFLRFEQEKMVVESPEGQSGTINPENWEFFVEVTHPQLVAALAKPGHRIIDSLTPQKAHLWHMASCIPGEVAETVEGLRPYIMGEATSPDRENLLEELGDIAFYFEGVWQGLDMLPPPYTPQLEIRQSITEITLHLVIASGQLFDAVKKFIIYEKEFDHAGTTDALHSFGQAFANLRGFANFTLEEVLDANIAKLSKRYAGLNYSDKAAQDRADKQPTGPTPVCGRI